MATITAELNLENKQLKAKLQESLAEVKNFKAQAIREGHGIGAGMFSGMRARMGEVMGIVGAPLGIGAAVMGLKSMAERFDLIEDSAAGMNATVEGMQRLQYMAAGTTTPFEAMTRGLFQIKRALFEVDDEAKQRALANIGIDARSFMALDADAAFIQLARSFQLAQKDGKGFADIFELIKKSAPDLIPALRTNSDELDRMGRRFAMSAETISDFTANLGAAKSIAMEWTNNLAEFISGTGDLIKHLGAGFEGILEGQNFLHAAAEAEREDLRKTKQEAEAAAAARKKLADAEIDHAEKLKTIRAAEKAAREQEAAERAGRDARKAAEGVGAEEQRTRIKELRAGGRTKEADKLERAQKQEDDMRRMRDAHPEKGEAWARDLAQRNAAAERAVPGRIHGYKHVEPPMGTKLDWIYGHNAERGGRPLREDFKFEMPHRPSQKKGGGAQGGHDESLKKTNDLLTEIKGILDC